MTRKTINVGQAQIGSGQNAGHCRRYMFLDKRRDGPLASAVAIGVAPLWPTQWFKIPFNRTHRIAAANSRSLEHACKPLEIGETQGKGPMCRGSDILLLKDVRRNDGRYGNKFDGLRHLNFRLSVFG